MKNAFFIFVCLALSVLVVPAQTEKSKAATQMPGAQAETKRVEMKKLDALIGQWRGSGWIIHEKGKETFDGTENVQRKIDGLALLVEGNFKNRDGLTIHETLAVLSPNLKTKNYDFRTYLATGIGGEYEFKATEDGWRWGFSFPRVETRYDVKIENETWLEIGEMSRDGGKTWIKFFEMNLKKVK